MASFKIGLKGIFLIKYLILMNVTIVTGWKGTRDKESSNQKPRRVDFINPCSRVWVVMPYGLVAVFSIVSRCGWIRAVLVVVLVGHTLLSGTGERERVRFLSHGEASRLVSVSMLLKSRQADEPQVWPISPWWAVNMCSSCISRATLICTRDARHTMIIVTIMGILVKNIYNIFLIYSIRKFYFNMMRTIKYKLHHKDVGMFF